MELRAKYQIQDLEKLIKEDLERQGFVMLGIDNKRTSLEPNLTGMELWFEIGPAPAPAVIETEIPAQVVEERPAQKTSKRSKGVYPQERVQKMVEAKKRKAEERKAQQEAEARIEETRQAVAAVYSANGNGHHEVPITETVEVVAATGPSFPGE